MSCILLLSLQFHECLTGNEEESTIQVFFIRELR